MRPPLAWLTRSPRRGGLSTARRSLSVVRSWEVVAFLLWRSPQVGRTPPNIFQSVHGLHQDFQGAVRFLPLRGNAPGMPNIYGVFVHLLWFVTAAAFLGGGAFPLAFDYMHSPLKLSVLPWTSWKLFSSLYRDRAADGRAGRKETGEARTADREDGRKLETRRRQEQASIKRAAKLVRLNGCLCIFYWFIMY